MNNETKRTAGSLILSSVAPHCILARDEDNIRFIVCKMQNTHRSEQIANAAHIVESWNNYDRVLAENERLKADLNVMGIDGMVMKLLAEREELAAALQASVDQEFIACSCETLDWFGEGHSSACLYEIARAALAKLETK